MGKEKFQDLGWANGWKEKPDIVVKCQAAGHKTTEQSFGPPFQKFEHHVTCEICRYKYKYDSS